MAATIKSLLARGNYVAVERGRLVITPISGKPVPEDWYRDNLHAFMAEIAGATGTNIFQYHRYHAGKFGVKNFEGVLLDYVSVTTGESAQVFYNADLTKDRRSKTGKKGDPLPKNQFRVGELGEFVKLWLRLGLKLPNRLSMFHRYMGNLKSVYVVGEVQQHRFIKPSIQFASIGMEELKTAVGISGYVDNLQTRCRQGVDKMQTRSVDKEIAQSHAPQGFQAISDTDDVTTYLSNQVGACEAMPLDSLSIGIESNTNHYVDDPSTKINALPDHLSDWMTKIERDHQSRLATKRPN